jgi:hypothetical protein
MRKFAAWLTFGWRTEAFELAQRKVAPPRQRREPWGCMAGTVTILPGTDLTAPSDEKWNAEEGRLLNE